MIWSAIFAAAFAGDTYRWSADSYVLIQPSSRPGVEAEVVFLNEDIHASGGEFVLTLDGLSVAVTIRPRHHGAHAPRPYHRDPARWLHGLSA